MTPEEKFETFKKEYYEKNKEQIKRNIRNDNIFAVFFSIFIFTIVIVGVIYNIQH